MDAKNKPVSFAMAMRDFFGLKEGQKLQDFAAEVKELDADARAFFTLGLGANGYTVIPPTT